MEHDIHQYTQHGLTPQEALELCTPTINTTHILPNQHNNPWIEFLKTHKGQGYSIQELKEMYRSTKQTVEKKSVGSKIEEAKDLNMETLSVNKSHAECTSRASEDCKEDKKTKSNAWLEFRKQYKGQGYSMQELGEMYRAQAGKRSDLQDSHPIPTKDEKKKKEKSTKPNPWVEFLKQHKGQGYSMQELSLMYRNRPATVHTETSPVYVYPNIGQTWTVCPRTQDVRMKSEYLKGEDIAKMFDLQHSVVVVENGKLLDPSRMSTLNKFPVYAGVYLVLVREFNCSSWVPFYLGVATRGVQRRMKDYVIKDQFSMVSKTKDAVLNRLLENKASIQIRFFTVEESETGVKEEIESKSIENDNAISPVLKQLERDILSAIDFPLNCRMNVSYRAIERPSGKGGLIELVEGQESSDSDLGEDVI